VSTRIPVFVYADDPISQAGLASQLRPRPEIWVVDDNVDAATVAVVVCDSVDDQVVNVVKAIQRNGCPKVVLVATRLDDVGLLAAAEVGVSGLLRSQEAQLGRLLAQVGRLQRQVLSPRGLTFSGLSERELDVLRLVADGLDTSEIAERLCYSDRTVKNVIHDVTTRLQLRNRSHAVAYAVREGLI